MIVDHLSKNDMALRNIRGCPPVVVFSHSPLLLEQALVLLDVNLQPSLIPSVAHLLHTAPHSSSSSSASRGARAGTGAASRVVVVVALRQPPGWALSLSAARDVCCDDRRF
jgi:hypothetical protein